MRINESSYFGEIGLGKTFLPIPPENLVLWLDASDSATLFDSVVGGSAVTSNGAAVKRWADKSGNGNNATEETNAPTLSTNFKNGNNAINFSSNKYLTGSFNSAGTFSAESVFCVLRWNAGNNIGQRMFTQRASGEADNDGFIPIINYNFLGTNYISSYGGGLYRFGYDTAPVATSNSHYLITILMSSGFNSLKANGTTISGNFSVSKAFTQYRLCAGISSDSSVPSGTYGDSVICEVICYNTNVSSENQTSIESYLNNKWAIY